MATTKDASKATATKKASTAKPAAKKTTTVKKPAAVKKTAVKKASTKNTAASPEALYKMTEVAAYYIALNDGFKGNPTDYWIAAEIQIQKLHQ